MVLILIFLDMATLVNSHTLPNLLALLYQIFPNKLYTLNLSNHTLNLDTLHHSMANQLTIILLLLGLTLLVLSWHQSSFRNILNSLT